MKRQNTFYSKIKPLNEDDVIASVEKMLERSPFTESSESAKKNELKVIANSEFKNAIKNIIKKSGYGNDNSLSYGEIKKIIKEEFLTAFKKQIEQ